MPLVKRTGAILIALFLTLTLVAPQTARADATTDKSVNTASTWIADTWRDKKNLFFAAGTTADGVIALSAANQYPDTVRSMLVDLKKNGPAFSKNYPAGLAKIIMTADMAGQNPRTFFGCERNLVTELQALIATDAGRKKAKEYWGPQLIAIALSRANEPVPQWVIDELKGNQLADGGFTGTSGKAEPDATAVGITAMNLLSQNTKNSAYKKQAAASVNKAQTWSAQSVNRKQDPQGYYWATYSSSNSTGMLASALGEVGVDIVSPQRYLVSQQTSEGAWGASHNSKRPNVMATTQAILGVIGEGYGADRSTQVPEMSNCGTTNPVKPTPPTKPTPPETVYNTPGDRVVNGREWRTTCGKYSTQINRCKTLIKAKTVKQVRGKFVTANEYVFNNLTYLPAPRPAWKNNRLAANGVVNGKLSWTATDGRKWRTECDTAVTGRGGCRSYITSKVIANVAKPGQPVRYGWVTKDIFNNVVQFS